jgi:1-phosphatidylinositol-4-phosphate 5-kinase
MGVTPELYLESLCSGLSFIDFIANSRSGQFFFYSFDGVFMIKTVRQDEKDFLLRLLPGYYKHLLKHALRQNNVPGASDVSFYPNGNASLLTRFYGLHCTKLRHLRRKVHFVVMSSIYGANTSSRMIQFDLKGSQYNRSAQKEDKVLKDNDCIAMGVKLRVGRDKADALLESARHDAAFLARHGVMDYSLLVGIFQPDNAPHDHFLSDPKPKKETDYTTSIQMNASPGPPLNEMPSGEQLSEFNSRHFSRLPSSLSTPAEVNVKIAQAVTAIQSLKASPFGLDGAENHVNVRNAKTTNNAVTDETLLPAAYDVAIEGISDCGQRELYYLGIIDILQKYNVRKHLETDLNILTRGLRHYKECSCVSPNEYRDRFLKFLRRIF